jgi:hypothetical protein
MPRIEYKPVRRMNAASNWLVRHRSNVTSQCGQDGIFAKIFELIGCKNKWCIEFGAADGKWLSNTWTLIANEGWDGVLIEAKTERHAKIAENHPGNPKARGLNVWVDYEGENTLDKILARAGAPKDIDLMCIDIDGNDWHVWDSLVEYRPRLVNIEFNPTIPNDVLFVQDRDPAVNQGNSLAAFIELGKSKGYSLVCVSSWDAMFVPDELFPLFGIADNSIDAMFDNGYETKLFQGYDGTFWMAGNLKVQWKQIPFQPDAFQVLPAEKRHYG